MENQTDAERRTIIDQALGASGNTKAPTSFKELYLRECKTLGDELKEGEGSLVARKDAAGEPWIVFTPKDRFGLALSGGGIRSATFNLGLLQSLAHLGALKHVDYLATVSGGGYVGGFWTAWLQRNHDNPGKERFPLGNDQRGGEREEVRHLREFSRFLLPRVGVMETELWGIAMTVLGGLVPSLLAAAAVLFLCWAGWVGLLALLLLGKPWSVVAMAVLLGAYLGRSEQKWSQSGKSEYNRLALVGYAEGSLIGWALAVVAWWHWPPPIPFSPPGGAPNGAAIFAPSVLLGGCLIVLLMMRVVMARFFRGKDGVSFLDGFERALARFVGLTTGLTIMALLWWVSGLLHEGFHGLALRFTAAGAVASAGLFAWAKKWLTSPREETHGSSLFDAVVKRLKRATPKLLASLTWLLLFLLVGAAMHALKLSPHQVAPGRPGWEHFWMVTGLGLAVVGLTAWLFDPARVGMHEFYRARISRCYLGASNADKRKSDFVYERPANNRHVTERPGDDLTLDDLQKVSRPLHLVCVAANDISGDPLGGLYRGARSAVLSANGISLGDDTAPLNDLRLSSALTASAAAFNSQMGRLSMDLGPAVTFLMSALNLRLGLWVPHPKNPHREDYVFPGRFFLYELLGRSRADGDHLHLSDGNHFENFGLYELVRRHCRHIIVSDCGADPEVAFDDLANVLRRVREDFGVEIELDITPLRPGPDGLARQHAVVGTIHYDGNTGMDKGTILFFKSTLTGDEPPDVLQYRTRNPAFPHESTGDQFYDESQWESYRRLGEHAGRVVLGSLERPDAKKTNQTDRLFLLARSRWHPAPERQHEAFLDLSGRCASIESELMAQGPRELRAEFFSEAAEIAGAPAAPKAPGGGSSPQPDAVDESALDKELRILGYLMRIMQVMEDVWLAADLEHFWSHPLNEGWMNYFQRWASAPSFRRWWPILAPIYCPGFRDFAKERFGVGVTDRKAREGQERAITAAQLELAVQDKARFGSGRIWRLFQQRFPSVELPEHATILGYEIELLGNDGKLGGKKLQVGFALVTETKTLEGWTAAWRANEFFVPHALHGSGILARMLDAVIAHYRDFKSSEDDRDPKRKEFVRLEVQFSQSRSGAKNRQPEEREKSDDRKPKLLGPAARNERVREIEFYKSREFRYAKPEDPETGEITLIRCFAGRDGELEKRRAAV